MLAEQWRYIVVVELLFLALFALWVWVRSTNPAITATEKPMEFAFLNSLGRTPTFPPADPWLSGFGISYYYFGYVMSSVLARLAFVTEAVAFNLSVAWLVAATGIGAFGVVFNLIASHKQDAKRAAYLLGLTAAIALPLAGNLVVILEAAHANGIGSAEIWQWLDVDNLNTPPTDTGMGETGPRFWWWWRSSRPISEMTVAGNPALEPIAEFPGFSFVLGDLHPHVLALPFAFLALGMALVWYLPTRRPTPEEGHTRSRPLAIELFFTALILGGLSFLNTWDVLIYLFVIVGAFALARWRDRGGWNGRIAIQAIGLAVGLVVAAIVLYFPFYLGFSSQTGAPFILPMLNRPTRLPQFLLIFGMPLLIIVALVLTVVVQQKFKAWKTGLSVFFSLIGGLLLIGVLLAWFIAASPASGSVVALADELGIVLDPNVGGLGWGLKAIVALAPAIFKSRLMTPGVTALTAGLIALIVMAWTNLFHDEDVAQRESQHVSALPFVLLLVITGALLTLGPEFLYIKDNFGQRMNTVFKFYYQAWVLWGSAALAGLYYLMQRAKVVALVAGGLYGVLLIGAMLFPWYGVAARSAEFTYDNTLNGLARLAQDNPAEYEALLWLSNNIDATPVILEATGGQYSDFARVSANTGIPTVLGWAGHEYQWRGSTPEPAAREAAITAIYQQSDWIGVPELLDRYGVDYIYVGDLERGTYGETGLQKFEDDLDIVFENDGVTIYVWRGNLGS
jgi:YYY domain-containing protein